MPKAHKLVSLLTLSATGSINSKSKRSNKVFTLSGMRFLQSERLYDAYTLFDVFKCRFICHEYFRITSVTPAHLVACGQE